jgi:hypothetical protein
LAECARPRAQQAANSPTRPTSSLLRYLPPLLPLWNGPAASKAAASCAHSKRFATERVPPVTWYVTELMPQSTMARWFRARRGRSGFGPAARQGPYCAFLTDQPPQVVTKLSPVAGFSCLGDPSEPSLEPPTARRLAPSFSNPAPDPPAGCTGDSPLPPRSTSDRRSEVLRRSNGEAPMRLP